MHIIEQVKQSVNKEKGETLRFTGTTVKSHLGYVVLVYGIQQAEGGIRTKVEYYKKNDGEIQKETKFDQILDAVNFERFLHKVAVAIQTHDPNNKFVEIPQY